MVVEETANDVLVSQNSRIILDEHSLSMIPDVPVGRAGGVTSVSVVVEVRFRCCGVQR